MAMEPPPVECHAGYTYPQRPTAVHWQDQRHPVEKVQAEWRTPQGKGFRVQCRGGVVFQLFYHQDAREWNVEPV